MQNWNQKFKVKNAKFAPTRYRAKRDQRRGAILSGSLRIDPLTGPLEEFRSLEY